MDKLLRRRIEFLENAPGVSMPRTITTMGPMAWRKTTISRRLMLGLSDRPPVSALSTHGRSYGCKLPGSGGERGDDGQA